METLNTEFTLSRLERVISGPGKIAALGEELERRGLKRLAVTARNRPERFVSRPIPAH